MVHTPFCVIRVGDKVGARKLIFSLCKEEVGSETEIRMYRVEG
jgi:hypothetical protein